VRYDLIVPHMAFEDHVRYVAVVLTLSAAPRCSESWRVRSPAAPSDHCGPTGFADPLISS